jgi:hypothetical protein
MGKSRPMNADGLLEQIVPFVEGLLPPNWVVALHEEDFLYYPQVLNIKIEVLPPSYAVASDTPTDPTPVMNVYPVSFFENARANARKAHRKFGDFLFYDTCICISGEEQWQAAVVHELAHLAQLRYGAYELHRNRSLQPFIAASMVEADVHGPIFQNTYRLFIRRVEKAYGKEVSRPMWFDLRAFETG